MIGGSRVGKSVTKPPANRVAIILFYRPDGSHEATYWDTPDECDGVFGTDAKIPAKVTELMRTLNSREELLAEGGKCVKYLM